MSNTASSSGVMAGKKGLIMGVANDRSIAWGIAAKLTFQGEALQKRVEPLAASVGSDLVIPCDVTDEASMDATFDVLKEKWGSLDFVLHAIAQAAIISRGRWIFRSIPSPTLRAALPR